MQNLLLDALKCKNTSRPPVWLMRQAGRYMTEYMELRKKYSLIDMFHNPEVAAKVTRLPIDKFGFDAAILFSDILVIAEALGAGLNFHESAGPVILRPVTQESDIDNLSTAPVRESLSYVAEEIPLILEGIDVPLIGFCGGPFTVASYMIEGGASKELQKTKKWLMRNPESFHKLLSKITQATIDYVNMQIDCGVHAIQIFDSWANYLSYNHFLEFSMPYMQQIIQGIKKTETPVILFCRGSSVFARALTTINPACISLDWNIDISEARSIIPSSIAVQGNLDPDFLYASPEALKSEVRRMLDVMQGDCGYIFNLGHGVKPDMPEDSVKLLVDTIHEAPCYLGSRG